MGGLLKPDLGKLIYAALGFIVLPMILGAIKR